MKKLLIGLTLLTSVLSFASVNTDDTLLLDASCKIECENIREKSGTGTRLLGKSYGYSDTIHKDVIGKTKENIEKELRLACKSTFEGQISESTNNYAGESETAEYTLTTSILGSRDCTYFKH